MNKLHLASLSILLLSGTAFSQESQVTMELLNAEGNTPIGTISLNDSEFGLVLTPNLSSLTPGVHGFHVHQTGNCEPVTKDGKTVLGGGAGGHYDPDNTGKHGTPWSTDNHKGDLPPLYVDEHGKATTAVLAPRLKVNDVKGKSLMVHVGGDNHSDHPAPLGGGGARMACGVIK
ncbi:superoxide dismutase, copper/zinc binding [Shewanella sp. W3-18-1]|uniref:superoxide dismutase family protein n=1 Tax=Shewanella sp. (strain W3-18-1) TaxID=351745 RepID=UPI00005FD650|nr:superoxide dismutase family protein [Shewanella sp. W3-18-1]ABM26583.1 superoxide dismutase, copper/zinc binding [Shewanella sp. W3-18-1]